MSTTTVPGWVTLVPAPEIAPAVPEVVRRPETQPEPAALVTAQSVALDARPVAEAWPYVSTRLDLVWLPDWRTVPLVLVQPAGGETVPYYRVCALVLARLCLALERLPDQGQQREAAERIQPLFDWVSDWRPGTVWADAFAQARDPGAWAPWAEYLERVRGEAGAIDRATRADAGPSAELTAFLKSWREDEEEDANGAPEGE